MIFCLTLRSAWQVRFELPENKGWLNVKLNQATRKIDGVPSLIGINCERIRRRENSKSDAQLV